MVIDKTKMVTKVLAVICALCAVLGLVQTLKAFILYRFVVTLADVALAFVCFKGIGKDKEICVGVYGVMAVFEIVRVFLEESLNLSSGILMLLRILCYVAIVAYLLGVIKNKMVPIIGGSIVSLLLLKNLYNLIMIYKNMPTFMGGMKITGDTIFHMVGIAAYIVPTLVITILIATDAVKIIKE